jgi:hypothetical protein
VNTKVEREVDTRVEIRTETKKKQLPIRNDSSLEVFSESL